MGSYGLGGDAEQSLSAGNAIDFAALAAGPGRGWVDARKVRASRGTLRRLVFKPMRGNAMLGRVSLKVRI
jgi:hypothetical protein